MMADETFYKPVARFFLTVRDILAETTLLLHFLHPRTTITLHCFSQHQQPQWMMQHVDIYGGGGSSSITGDGGINPSVW